MAPVSRKASASSSSSSSPSTPPKKTFDLSKLKSPIKKDAHLEKKGGANDKPHFSIFRPVYQEGERVGEETRNRIVRWRSRYHLKADADAAIRPLILKETPRWMPEPLKVFQAKIFSVVQARTILNALRAVEGEAGAIHLPQDVGDEEFETAKTAHVDVIPLTDKLMLQGLVRLYCCPKRTPRLIGRDTSLYPVGLTSSLLFVGDEGQGTTLLLTPARLRSHAWGLCLERKRFRLTSFQSWTGVRPI